MTKDSLSFHTKNRRIVCWDTSCTVLLAAEVSNGRTKSEKGGSSEVFSVDSMDFESGTSPALQMKSVAAVCCSFVIDRSHTLFCTFP